VRTIPLKAYPTDLRQRVQEQFRHVVAAVQETVQDSPALFADECRGEQNDLVDTGAYADSHVVRLTVHGAEMGNDAPHASFIEFGTRPHTPPWEPLYHWALRRTGGDAERAGALATSVRRSISERGTRPRHVYARLRAKMKLLLRARLARYGRVS
jgi:hypothetical protein